ncbi:MAG TPA: protein translocase subunit SecD [Anaerolineaceae bacterium]|jgi:preprotein translocase subunit SecD
MSQRNYGLLIFIVLLTAAVIWIDLPNNPGIHIFGINRNLDPQLGLDLRGGLEVLLEADVPASQTVTDQSIQDARAILENRSNALGVSEVTFQVSGARRIVGEFPGITNQDQVIEVLKQVGQLTFVPMGQTPLQEGTKIKVDLTTVGKPAGEATPLPLATSAVTPTATLSASPTAAASPTSTVATTSTPVVAQTPTSNSPTYNALMTGTQLSSVGVTRDTLGEYVISFTLNDAGKTLFADYTTKHVKDFLGIVLDGVVISSPQVINPITTGSGQISGKFTYDSANALAVQLRYGSLPIPLKILQTRSIGATLGQDSIRKSAIAGILGMAVVILFMGLYYRLPGVLADLALAIYVLTTFAIYKMIPVTLSLPGIAGFVLSVGVAVDANILIFERLKEELRAGRTLSQAIDLGWQRAWPSIRDSNISTLITCIILFWFGNTFGASLVKGFSLTLALGILVSLFTAIVVTRTFLHLVLDNLKLTEHPNWFGAGGDKA